MGEPDDVDPDVTVNLASSDTVAAASAGNPAVITRPDRSARPRTIEPPRPDYTDLTVVPREHYAITSEIARGGMGRIAVARDLRLGRDVAVKEILDASPDMMRRFEREVRITARLQHPSIVSVHEAGQWPSGEPFYAMKLVSGKSLDTIIDSTPTLAGRLAQIPAVLAVADAMAYSHQERVIHRDVKPQNVIVGDFGETVVIDWGLAKQLDAPDLMTSSGGHAPVDPGQTSAGEILGTLGYMPPEQANGEPVDERADVYAIGAILYHLLAGRPPFTGMNFGELFMKVREDKPSSIASIEPDAPPDLVAIAERAMSRDRDKRYPSAKELAEDLRRFQTGQLVGAHTYSLKELLVRWARRHAPVLAAVGVALVVIAVGAILAVRQIIDERERVAEKSEVASRSQADALALMHFMLHDLRARLSEYGRIDLLETAARKAASFYDEHRGNGTDADKVMEAESHVQIAEVFSAHGDRAAMTAEMAKATALADQVPTTSPVAVAAARINVNAMIMICRDTTVAGDTAAALPKCQAAIDLANRMLELHPDDRMVLLTKAKAMSEIAGVLGTRGDRAKAIAAERDALATLARIKVPHDRDADLLALIAHADIGDMLWAANDIDGALVEYRASEALSEYQAKAMPNAVEWQWHLSNNHDEIGHVLRYKHDAAGAMAEFVAAQKIDERLVMLEPTNVRYQHALGVAHESIGDMLSDAKDYDGAMHEFDLARESGLALLAIDPNNRNFQRDLSVSENKLGDVQAQTGDLVSAIASYRRGLAIRTKLIQLDPNNIGWQRELFYSHLHLGIVLEQLHTRAPAIEEIRAAIAFAQPLAARQPDNDSAQNDLASSRGALAGLLGDDNDLEGAKAEIVAVLEIAKRRAAVPKPNPRWARMIANAEAVLARINRAIASPPKQRPRH